MVTKVEILAAQESMIRTISQSAFEFREVILVNVVVVRLETVCAVIEAKGEHLKKDQWRNHGSLP